MRLTSNRPAWQEAPSAATRAVKGLVLAALVITMAYPLIYVVAVSFSTAEGVRQSPLFPLEYSFDAYEEIFSGGQVPIALGVSVLVTVIGSLLSLYFTATLAYGLSRTREVPGAKAALYLVFFTMLFSAGTIPTYLLVRDLGLLNNLASLIMPVLISAFNLVVIRNFFMELPDELVDSARMDGASDWRIFWGIILPLSKAPLAVIGLFYAVGYWNSYFYPMLFLTDTGIWPIQLILNQYVLQDSPLADLTPNPMGTPPPAQSVQMAIVVVSTAPILLLYPFLQRHFTKGVLTGAIKG